MKKLILLLAILTMGVAQAQFITGKRGNTYDVRNYETITVFASTHLFVNPTITLDGYDTLILNKKGIITDGDRIMKRKDVKRLAHREAFWITYLKKNGFKLQKNTTTPVTINGGSVTPGTMTLTFIK